LDLKKFDLEFNVDPLFKKTSADFDEGGARGLLLNHLNISASGQIIFDSGDVLLTTESITEKVVSVPIDLEKFQGTPFFFNKKKCFQQKKINPLYSCILY
jgi:condensin complex subunit 2